MKDKTDRTPLKITDEMSGENSVESPSMVVDTKSSVESPTRRSQPELEEPFALKEVQHGSSSNTISSRNKPTFGGRKKTVGATAPIVQVQNVDTMKRAVRSGVNQQLNARDILSSDPYMMPNEKKGSTLNSNYTQNLRDHS